MLFIHLLIVFLLDPEELSLLLAAAGLFKIAFEVCTLFELSYINVFDFLTRRCIRLTLHEDDMDWSWLLENDVQGKGQMSLTSHVYGCVDHYNTANQNLLVVS